VNDVDLALNQFSRVLIELLSAQSMAIHVKRQVVALDKSEAT
jgi:hypothetical protein